MRTRSMQRANATKASYERVGTERDKRLSKRELNKTVDKLESHGVSSSEKKFAAETIGDDKMSAAGRRAFRKFMADDGKPNEKTKARESFAHKVAAHSTGDSQLGKTLSQLEVRQELAELRKHGATKEDEQYARAIYKGKKMSPAARAELQKFTKETKGT